jgi:hypothetical protein
LGEGDFPFAHGLFSFFQEDTMTLKDTDGRDEGYGVVTTKEDDLTHAKIECLSEMSRRGCLKASAFEHEARDPGHILHDEFTWDDTECGVKYRKIEGRRLVGKFRVHVVVSQVTEKRAFSVKISAPDPQRVLAGLYYPVFSPGQNEQYVPTDSFDDEQLGAAELREWRKVMDLAKRAGGYSQMIGFRERNGVTAREILEPLVRYLE